MEREEPLEANAHTQETEASLLPPTGTPTKPSTTMALPISSMETQLDLVNSCISRKIITKKENILQFTHEHYWPSNKAI